jgi:15-cis-phytoene synthase
VERTKAGNVGSATTGMTLEQSYERCVAVTRERAANFHHAFTILPQPRYRGICALYAFTRMADDISDDEPDPAKALANSAAWRAAFDRAMAGDFDAPLGIETRGANGEALAEAAILPAVADTMKTYRIPVEYMHELITGTEMDGRQSRYENWDDTYLYCYRVASVIGMMTIHVFGFSDPKAVALAEKTGIAFQMTNILRDLTEDAQRNRIYLPLEDLRRFNVAEEELLAGKDSPKLRELVHFETDRAMEFYKAAPELVPLILDESRDAMSTLVGIYQRLLKKIEARKYDVFSERVSLSKGEKAALVAEFAWKKIRNFGN